MQALRLGPQLVGAGHIPPSTGGNKECESLAIFHVDVQVSFRKGLHLLLRHFCEDDVFLEVSLILMESALLK